MYLCHLYPFFFCRGLWCSLVLCPLAPSWSRLPIAGRAARRDACPWDRDSSVGGSATCLAPRAVRLSLPSFSSLGLVVFPGFQGDSEGPNWLMRVNGGCNFVGPVSAPVGMSTRILNNHPDAGSLEKCQPRSVVCSTHNHWMVDGFSWGWAVSSRGCPTQWNCRISTGILCTEISRNPEDHILCEYEVEKAPQQKCRAICGCGFCPSSFSCSVTDGTLHPNRAESCPFSALLSHFSIGTRLN